MSMFRARDGSRRTAAGTLDARDGARHSTDAPSGSTDAASSGAPDATHPKRMNAHPGNLFHAAGSSYPASTSLRGRADPLIEPAKSAVTLAFPWKIYRARANLHSSTLAVFAQVSVFQSNSRWHAPCSCSVTRRASAR